MDITPAFLEALTARVTEREAQLASAAVENPRKLRDLLKSHARLKKFWRRPTPWRACRRISANTRN